MASPVPVLLLTGPVGAGKSTVANEAARLLRELDVPHALVDLAWIGQCWPVPRDDPWNERLVHQNLACMWSNFSRAGVDRLIVGRVLEARSLLRHLAEAVPGARITVVRLRVRLEVLEARIRAREAARDSDWFLRPPPTWPRRWSAPRSRTTWSTTTTVPPSTRPGRRSTWPAGWAWRHRRRSRPEPPQSSDSW